MSSAAKPRKARPVKQRLLTIADVAALPETLPSGPVCYELNNGRLVIMPPAGDGHGGMELKLAAAMLYQGEYRNLGKARCGEVGIILWREPDRLVGADAAFIANRSLPIRVSKEGYLETIPDLVAEIRSKNDTAQQVADKVADYLRAGVKVVWIADPKKRIVTEHRPGVASKVYQETDTLTVEDIIPGFQFPVRNVFAE
jgi:Uma2 family endonuclease